MTIPDDTKFKIEQLTKNFVNRLRNTTGFDFSVTITNHKNELTCFVKNKRLWKSWKI